MSRALDITFMNGNSVTLCSSSIEDTILFGHLISKYITYPDFITLDGDLGMGKTLMARSIITYQLKYNEQVPSPSYLICLTYETPNNETINHIDPYRLKRNRPLSALINYEDILKKDLCIVEWPDLVPDLTNSVNQSKLSISINATKFNTESRTITLKTSNLKWLGVFAMWRCDKLVNVDTLLRNHRDTSAQIVMSQHDPIITTGSDYILGVETSCDDTCVAIIDGNGNIISNVKIGQEDVHEEFKGVNPKSAQEAHERNIELAATQAFNDANILPKDIQAVAVTQGPGLALCLIIGLFYAHKFSKANNVPLVKCHHLESHVAVSRLPSLNLDIKYPFLSVLVSGGHSMIIYMEGAGNYKIMSTTIDDSIGECFDKIARELGISVVPGGPELEKKANNGTIKYRFNSPFIKTAPHNMSFSGIKSNVIRLIRSQPILSTDVINDIACSFQSCVVKYLLKKIWDCSNSLEKENKPITSIVIAGGVASNKSVRDNLDSLGNHMHIPTKYPPINLCTDNGVMVAWNGVERLRKGIYEHPDDISNEKHHMDAFPKWKLK